MKNKLLNHIQFLRAISVLMVFFYHLKLNYFENGFLGVDIFFVISGYVITARIFNEYKSNNKFNFLNFYLKRLKRIYPVLIFILSTIFILIIFFQPLDLFLNYPKIYLFSLFGISNFYYLFSEKDYFDTVFDDPFAHTWSLGIEEQFYIIFPIFLFLLLYKVHKNKNITFFLIFTIFIGVISTFIFQKNTDLIFYSPFFRFWEFLIGSLTFFISRKIKFKNNFISLLFLFILIFFILINNNFVTPVIILITTLLSSVFILTYERNDSDIYNFVIENKYLIFLGNMSYSFYLWHLPVIYFYDLYFLENLFRVPILSFITIILSYFSYTYIENRFRYLEINWNTNFKKIILIILIIIPIVILINLNLYRDAPMNKVKNNLKNLVLNYNYLENKYNFTNRTVFSRYVNLNDKQVFILCRDSSKSKEVNSDNLKVNCLKKATNKNRIFYLQGHSGVANFIPMFDSLEVNDSIYYSYKNPLLVNINFQEINQLLESYDDIIYTTSIENLDSLNKLISIKDNFHPKIKILILGTIPHLDPNINPLKCLIKNIDCTYKTFEDKNFRNIYYLNSKIKKLISNDKKFIFFDPYEAICPEDICYVFNKEDSMLTHRDIHHLTLEGSILMKEKFNKLYKLQIVKNVALPKNMDIY